MSELGHLPARNPQNLSSYLPEGENFLSDHYRSINDIYELLILDQELKQDPTSPVEVLAQTGNLEMQIKPQVYNHGKGSGEVEYNVTFREGEEQVIFNVSNDEKHDILRIFKSTRTTQPDNVARIDGKSTEITDLIHMDATSLEMVEFDEKIQLFRDKQLRSQKTNVVVPILGAKLVNKD